MKLSDVMSAANLAIYAEVGLVLFLFAFMVVVGRVLLTKKGFYDDARRIPFEDGGSRVSPSVPSSKPLLEKQS